MHREKEDRQRACGPGLPVRGESSTKQPERRLGGLARFSAPDKVDSGS
jgi:hypothetical protein